MAWVSFKLKWENNIAEYGNIYKLSLHCPWIQGHTDHSEPHLQGLGLNIAPQNS